MKKSLYSEEMEMVVIAAMLSNQEALQVGLDELCVEHFNSHPSRQYFEAIQSFQRQKTRPDYGNVTDNLVRAEQLAPKEGALYTAKLDELVDKSYAFDSAVSILRQLHLKRQIMDLCMSTYRKIPQCEDPDTLLDKTQQILCSLSMSTQNNFSSHISFQLADYTKRLEERRQNGGRIQGLSTGFHSLDNLISGLNAQQLVILGARTSMGKTALALSMIYNMLCDKRGVGFFSLEMGHREICDRLISLSTDIHTADLMRGAITTAQYNQVNIIVKELIQSNLFVEDPAQCTMQQLRSKARYLVRQCNVEVLVIDYLQFIQATRRNDSRYVEVSQISNELKMLAKELHVPIVCLAQLARRVEERIDKTPQVSDLRESGNIEQDADIILLLKRPYVYDKSKPADLAEVNVCKNRNGQTGMVQLQFNAATMHFRDKSYMESWSEAQGT